MQQSVDYCLGLLEFEIVSVLEHIALNLVEDVLVRKKLLDELTAVSHFLKDGSITHLDGDNDVVHDTRWALIGYNDGTAGQQKDDKTKCLEFFKPFQVVDNIFRVVKPIQTA